MSQVELKPTIEDTLPSVLGTLFEHGNTSGVNLALQIAGKCRTNPEILGIMVSGIETLVCRISDVNDLGNENVLDNIGVGSIANMLQITEDPELREKLTGFLLAQINANINNSRSPMDWITYGVDMLKQCNPIEAIFGRSIKLILLYGNRVQIERIGQILGDGVRFVPEHNFQDENFDLLKGFDFDKVKEAQRMWYICKCVRVALGHPLTEVEKLSHDQVRTLLERVEFRLVELSMHLGVSEMKEIAGENNKEFDWRHWFGLMLDSVREDDKYLEGLPNKVKDLDVEIFYWILIANPKLFVAMVEAWCANGRESELIEYMNRIHDHTGESQIFWNLRLSLTWYVTKFNEGHEKYKEMFRYLKTIVNTEIAKAQLQQIVSMARENDIVLE